MISLDSDELAEEDTLELDETIKFEPYPTPPATPSVALLAASIREGKQHTEKRLNNTQKADNCPISIRNRNV